MRNLHFKCFVHYFINGNCSDKMVIQDWPDFVIHVKYHNIRVCIKESKWLTECKVLYPLGSPPASEGNMPGKVKVSGGLSSSVCKWSSVWEWVWVWERLNEGEWECILKEYWECVCDCERIVICGTQWVKVCQCESSVH